MNNLERPTRHRVQASIQHFPTHLCVVFIDPAVQQRIGRIRRYTSEEPIFEMLRRAHAADETLKLVERSLLERRPCMVDLTLTDDQLRKLRG